MVEIKCLLLLYKNEVKIILQSSASFMSIRLKENGSRKAAVSRRAIRRLRLIDEVAKYPLVIIVRIGLAVIGVIQIGLGSECGNDIVCIQ